MVLGLSRLEGNTRLYMFGGGSGDLVGVFGPDSVGGGRIVTNML